MLLAKGDGTHIATSSADLFCILHDKKAKRFHVAFFEESPMPGPIREVKDLEVLRLKSRMHHTEGAPTLKEAKVHLAELRRKIEVSDLSVLEEPLPWDGQVGIVLLSVNWVRENRKVVRKDIVR